MISPMCAQERVLGLFVVAGLQEITYDSADLAFLQQLANQLTIYLQDRELFAEVTRAKIEWENTFKAVKDLILVVDRETQILRVNLAALEHSGLSEEAIIGRKCCEVICSSTVPCNHCAVCEALRTGETASSQRQFDDGRVMEFYAYPSNNEQSEPGVVIYVRDITDRLKMQAQLLKTARLAALGEMSAGVAHELNTPLAVILGDIQLLLRDMPEDSPETEPLRRHQDVRPALQADRSRAAHLFTPGAVRVPSDSDQRRRQGGDESCRLPDRDGQHQDRHRLR